MQVKERPRYVSRGGDKLAHALEAFGFDPGGKTALDVGASTGGFTDCLLQRGASRVYAVDVGRGQLHNRLLVDDRVVSMERVNARKGFELPERVDLITADVSFISLRLVLPPALDHLRVGGAIIALLKPQFEAGPEKVGKGGVVRDRQTHAETIGQFVNWATAERLRVLDLTSSPLLGDKETGNSFFCLPNPNQHSLESRPSTATSGHLPTASGHCRPRPLCVESQCRVQAAKHSVGPGMDPAAMGRFQSSGSGVS